jgi:guanylate kinase
VNAGPRLVVILCGPAGAGKTTAAHASGLDVYDRDDAEWSSEKQFTARLADLARDPHARAVVIRSGATSSARAKAARLVSATHVYILTEDRRALARRVRARNRTDKVQGMISVNSWFDRFDRLDNVPDFPGWPEVLTTVVPVNTSEAW